MCDPIVANIEERVSYMSDPIVADIEDLKWVLTLLQI